MPATLRAAACDPDAWAHAMEKISARFGGLDMLVNNAGGGRGSGPIDRAELEAHRQMLELNVRGYGRGSRPRCR